MSEPRRPLWEVVRALRSGERVSCGTSHRFEATPVANFYCEKCLAPRCASCALNGVCIVCRAVVRSIGAILLAATEED